MVEYYKTNKGYCYKKTKKYGSIRISLEDYKKAVSKNGGVVKRKLKNIKNSNVTNNNIKNSNIASSNSTDKFTVKNGNNNISNNNNKKKKSRKSSFEYDNNGSKNFYYSKTNNEERQRREELTNELKKKFRKENLPIDENVIKIIINKTLKEESNAKKLFENPKLTKKNVWDFQMNIPGTFNNLESRKQMKKKLNQTERNRRKEIINAPRSPEEEKRRKKIVANILSNKNKVLPQNLANKIANMSREQLPPPPPLPRTHAGIQANNNQLDNAFWDDI